MANPAINHPPKKIFLALGMSVCRPCNGLMFIMKSMVELYGMVYGIGFTAYGPNHV